MYEDQEVAKWRKKKGRQSKIERRADHKHNYAPAISVKAEWSCAYNGEPHFYSRGFYCTECMKWKCGRCLWRLQDRVAWDAAHPDAVYVKLNEDHSCVVDFIKKI